MTEFEYQKQQDKLQQEFEGRVETCTDCEYALTSEKDGKKYCCDNVGGYFDGRDIETMCAETERCGCENGTGEYDN